MLKVLPAFVNFRRAFRFTFPKALGSFLAPPQCVLCGSAGQSAEGSWGFDLCRYCEVALPALPRGICARCGEVAAPLIPGFGCETCRGYHRMLGGVLAAFAYEDPVDSLIAGLKFGQNRSHARVMAALMLQAQRQQGAELLTPPNLGCLVPIPLHQQRLFERGFNQSAELAGHLARSLKIPISTQLLTRQSFITPQRGLSAQARQRNTAHVFKVNAGQPIPTLITLVDDVMTTGATLFDAALALRLAGCLRVNAWVFARALKAI